MPEAVIVSAARTPIGRARKGSLVDARPDDLAAFAIDAALKQVPALPREEIVDVMIGCGFPQDRQGMNLARRAALLAGLPASGPGHDGQPLLRIVAPDDPDGVPRDPRRRGRRVRRRRGRVDHAGERLPEGHRGAPPQAVRRRRADRERLHPDGPDGRERRGAVGRLARGDGPVRAALAGARGRRAGVRVLRARAHAVGRRREGRRAAGGLDAREARVARAGLQAGREGDGRKRVPAERRRGRGRRDERHACARARPDAARADHRVGSLGRRAGDHGRRPDRRGAERA